MDFINLFFIAFALSLDAFSVSIINGLIIDSLSWKRALFIASSFGFFQGCMPFIGWSSGLIFRSYIQVYAQWAAFIILCLVGLHMLHSSFSKPDSCSSRSCLHFGTLIIMSFATSIDALVVGITFSILETGILVPVLIIASVTLVVCFTGLLIANRFSFINERVIEGLGGIVIIVIGIRILAS